MKTALLRAQLEQTLRGKVSSPFSPRPPAAAVMAASGIPEIDRLTGGLPRGCVTEIVGPAGSGRTSLLVSLLATLTQRKESCALVDGRDSFDPCGAEAAGVALERLLLVRCREIDQAMRAADLLLHGGGFGMIALDLSDLPGATVRRVPLNVWFRFRRMVENTPTAFILIEQESCAKTCASLVLRLEMKAAQWRQSRAASVAAGNSQQVLLGGLRIHAEVMRSRFEVAEEMAEEMAEEVAEENPGRRPYSAREIAAPGIHAPGADCTFQSEAAWIDLTEKRRRRKNGAPSDALPPTRRGGS
jgi:hypothetical protein